MEIIFEILKKNKGRMIKILENMPLFVRSLHQLKVDELGNPFTGSRKKKS